MGGNTTTGENSMSDLAARDRKEAQYALRRHEIYRDALSVISKTTFKSLAQWKQFLRLISSRYRDAHYEYFPDEARRLHNANARAKTQASFLEKAA